MRVFVTGATGAIGSHVIPVLVAAGRQVSALARTPEKATVLRRQGATAVMVSLFDRGALTGAFDGHDAVANLATAIPPMTKFMSARAWQANQRVRTEGSAAVVDAALAAGVGRLVQESVSMLYADGGDQWVDEDGSTDRFPAAVGNHAAEANAHRFTAAGGIGVVLRFGWFYGPGAAHSEQMLAQARHHVVLTLGAPGSYLSPIHMTDAALAAAAGQKPWVRGPGRAALAFGDHTTSLTRSLRVSNAKLRSAGGWAPQHPSAREGWVATARALPPGHR